MLPPWRDSSRSSRWIPPESPHGVLPRPKQPDSNSDLNTPLGWDETAGFEAAIFQKSGELHWTEFRQPSETASMT